MADVESAANNRLELTVQTLSGKSASLVTCGSTSPQEVLSGLYRGPWLSLNSQLYIKFHVRKGFNRFKGKI